MVQNTLQSSYPRYQPIAQAGMPASEHGWDADSKILESASAGWGLACSRGTDKDNGAIIGGADFVGVTMIDRNVPASNEDKFVQYDLMGLMVRGDIWVKVTAAVTPDTAVKFSATTGEFGDTGGTALSGAKYQTSGGVGDLVRLRIA